MKLAVFNGSPRGKGSNTTVLLDNFLDGYMTNDGNSYELGYLANEKEADKNIELFKEADRVLIAFPLYFDSMPANVKTFIESLAPLCLRSGNPGIGFIIQSGFPEPDHSKYVESYLEKLARRLGCIYSGTIIRGAFETIRVPFMIDNIFHKIFIAGGKITNMGRVGHFFNTKKLYKKIFRLGMTFGKTGEFDKKIVQQLAKPEKLSRFGSCLFRFVGKHLYWNILLKRNNAYDKRFDTPYADQ